MSHLLAYLAYEEKLKVWAATKSPVLRLALPNVSFVSKVGETYIRPRSIPADTRNDDISLDTQTYTGIIQIDIVFPKDAGTGLAGTLIDELTEVVFKRNDRLSKGVVKVQSTSPLKKGPPIVEEGNIYIPCSISYWARLVIAS